MKTLTYNCSECDEVHKLYESCNSYVAKFIDWLDDAWLEPLPYKLVILPDPEKGKVGGIIHLPDKYQDIPSMGTVIACGENVKQVKVGDRVLYGKYAGIGYETGSLFSLKLIKEDEIICLLVPQVNYEKRLMLETVIKKRLPSLMAS
jgi:chaperonin GroES